MQRRQRGSAPTRRCTQRVHRLSQFGQVQKVEVGAETSAKRSYAWAHRIGGGGEGAVGGCDAHRRIDREAAAVFTFRHRLRIITRQQAAAHEPAQNPPAHLRLHLGDGGGIEAGGGTEDDPARGGVEQRLVPRARRLCQRIRILPCSTGVTPSKRADCHANLPPRYQ